MRNVIKNVTKTVSETLEIPEDKVSIAVTQMLRSHWGKGGVPVSDMNKK